jgi:hypothetical protein
MKDTFEMHFSDPDLSAYLSGSKFDEHLAVVLDGHAGIADRVEIISGLIAGKNVVDIGFVDHEQLVDGKIAANDWLHGQLCRVASRCLGVDINATGVKHVQERYRVSDVLVADLAGPGNVPALRETFWDYFVLAEVLEHIDNPVEFLTAIRENYGGCFGSLIITVPNAFCGGNLISSLRGREIINSDHRFWFTPYTLAKVVTMSGYRIRSFRFASYSHNSAPKRFAKNIVLRFAPMLAERIVLVCSPD